MRGMASPRTVAACALLSSPPSAMCADPGPDRVWIEIDPAAEPISGVLHHGSEPARSFDGWLELVALLETERRPGPRRDVPPDQG